VEVSGSVSAKSEIAAVMALSQRIMSSQPWMVLLCGSVAAAFAFLGAGGLRAVVPEDSMGPISLLASGLIMAGAVVGLSAVQQRGLLRALTERGVTYPSRQTLRIADDALHLSTPMIRVSSPWIGVSEVTRTPDGWLIILSGMGCNIPTAFFEDKDAERAFIRALLERMSEAARARSRHATDFLGVWG